jgi:hypothetical protein
MEQPSYQPDPHEVGEKLASLFPSGTDRERARGDLAEYGGDELHRDVDRVRLAILRLSEGDPDRVSELVALALTDYRDVLAAAEYPNYSQLEPGIDPNAPEAQEAIRADWEQYNDWVQGWS